MGVLTPWMSKNSAQINAVMFFCVSDKPPPFIRGNVSSGDNISACFLGLICQPIILCAYQDKHFDAGEILLYTRDISRNSIIFCEIIHDYHVRDICCA